MVRAWGKERILEVYRRRLGLSNTALPWPLGYGMIATMPAFEVTHTARHTRARTGVLQTPHGDIPTPNFMLVATRGVLHGMELDDARLCGADVLMCNTHHLNRQHGIKAIATAGGLHQFIGWHHPLATDSGGFQVFSLGWGMIHGVGKVAGGINARPSGTTALASAQATIDNDGVIFSDGRELVRLTPEIATRWQEQLGADIIFAFDECTSPLHDENYNRQALERTHRWAGRCLEARTRHDQLMFGIVQGGTFEALRRKSAQVIGAMPFDGIGIGGSFGQHAMVTTLDWIMPLLPKNKPIHLLGIGWIQDILLAVDRGVDLFDCVEPIRRARHQHVLTQTHYTDIVPLARQQGDGPLVNDCDCSSCTRLSAADIKQRCRAHDYRGSRALAIHNTRMMMQLMQDIRAAITEGRWENFKQEKLSAIEEHYPVIVGGARV